MLERDLTILLNSYSEENRANTPDFILAAYMLQCLNAFNTGVRRRDEWYGISPAPGAPVSPKYPVRDDE